MTGVLRIDVWSDIACPWCYIGKRNLEAGLATVAEDDDPPQVEVVLHSYRLAPETPTDYAGSEADYLVEHRGFSHDDVQGMLEQVTRVAADVGLAYRMDLVRHTNTAHAHELLHLAAERGRQDAVAERLMAGYFLEGRHLGREDDLVQLAAEAGLDPEEARAALHDGRYRDSVRADEEQAASYGIGGVPFFVIDGRYGISGAQPPDAFAGIARRVWGELRASEGTEPRREPDPVAAVGSD